MAKKTKKQPAGQAAPSSSAPAPNAPGPSAATSAPGPSVTLQGR